MQPMTPQQQAFMQQMALENQRAANERQAQAQSAQLNALRPQPMQPQPAQLQQGVSAFWTGKSQSGQSVTGAVGMNCEYQYGGRYFWRMFQGYCPSSIQIQ
jgi:Tfp pilus assembly protein PilV